MDAQQQAQLDQSNAAKQAQSAPALTPEQMQQQRAMQEAMQRQQEQLQVHINGEIQKGLVTYNLDVQREVAEMQKLTLAAQGLEACVNAAKTLGLDLGLDIQSAVCNVALKIRQLLGKAEATENVSCETAKAIKWC